MHILEVEEKVGEVNRGSSVLSGGFGQSGKKVNSTRCAKSSD